MGAKLPFYTGVLLLSWCSPGNLSAQAPHTYYVAPSGYDTNPGSASEPFATLKKAAGVVVPGDTVLVADGHYAGFEVKRGGTSNTERVTFRSINRAVDDHGNATGSGAIIDQPISASWTDYLSINSFKYPERADYVTIDGFAFVDATNRAIGMFGTVGLVVTHCHILNTRTGAQGHQNRDATYEYNLFEGNGAGDSFMHHLYFAEGSGECTGAIPMTGLLIRRNVFKDSPPGSGASIHFMSHLPGYRHQGIIEENIFAWNGGADITAMALEHSDIRNNLFYSNNGTNGIVRVEVGAPYCGFDEMDANHHIRIYNNTFYATDTNAVYLRDIPSHGPMDGEGMVIFNNLIIAETAPQCIVNQSSVPVTIESNICHSFTEANIGTTLATLFVDHQSDDFHLRPGSEAHNTGIAGTAGIAAPELDCDGAERKGTSGSWLGGTVDIGAYEIQEGTPPAGDAGPGDIVSAPDVVIAPDVVTAPDVVVPADVVVVPDVATTSDTATAPDAPTAPDVLPIPDLETTPDLATTPDVVTMTDVLTAPDMDTVPDRATAPDVTTGVAREAGTGVVLTEGCSCRQVGRAMPRGLAVIGVLFCLASWRRQYRRLE